MTHRAAAAFDTGGDSASGLWKRLVEHFRPPPIATPEAFSRFLEERASLIAQKCAVDYCRGKTGLASYALFTEKPFLDALDVCRWETFAAVLGDLCIVAEGHLRPHVEPERRGPLGDAMAGLYTAILTALPAPVHRARGWDDAVASFALRIQAVAAGEPKQAVEVADYSAKRMFDTLPIHSSMRELDEEVVYGAVRFRVIAVSQEMQRRFDVPALVVALLDT